MILVEIKRTDDSPWETRLYNTTWGQFRSMADKRFVAIGKSVIFEGGQLIQELRKNFGWDAYEDGRYSKKPREVK